MVRTAKVSGGAVLVTITYNGPDASDLGYLLHKNPTKAQSFDLNVGVASVF